MGERVDWGRQGRYVGIFIFFLAVLAWVGLQQRPAITDAEVAEGVEWAESTPWLDCERPVLTGEPVEGDGSVALIALVESHGCTDAECRILRDAVQHDAVCAPRRRPNELWLDGVVEHAMTLEPTDAMWLLMHALRALDDHRRGELRILPFPYETEKLHAAVQSVLSQLGAAEHRELSRAADLLVTTSPDSFELMTPFIASFVLHVLRRGRSHRRSRHPRAAVVAWTRLAKRIESCRSMECLERELADLPYPEPVSKVRMFIQGPPIAHDFQIEGISIYARGRILEAVPRLEAHRATERLLAASLRLLSHCDEEVALDDLAVTLERNGEAITLRDGTLPDRTLEVRCPSVDRFEDDANGPVGGR